MRRFEDFENIMIFIVTPFILVLLFFYDRTFVLVGLFLLPVIIKIWNEFARPYKSMLLEKEAEKLSKNHSLEIAVARKIALGQIGLESALEDREKRIIAEASELTKRYHMEPDWAKRVASGKATLEEFIQFKAKQLSESFPIPIAIARQIASGELSFEEYRKTYAAKLTMEYVIEATEALAIFDRKINLAQVLENRAQVISDELGITLDDARQYTSNSTGLEKLFPFQMPGIQEPQRIFHLAELTSEPNGIISGSRVNVWVYKAPMAPKQFVVAGHANGPVCRQVSALIDTAYLNLTSIDKALVVPGAGILAREDIDPEILGKLMQQQPSQLEDKGNLRDRLSDYQILDNLTKDLMRIQNDSGLVSLIFCDAADANSLNQLVEESIARFRQTKISNLFVRNTENKQPKAAFLPFYAINKEKPEALVFELDLELFNCEEFEYLKDYHKRSLILEMTNDARRRKRIYEEWLDRDERNYNSLKYHIEKMTSEERQRESIVVSGTRNYEEATETRGEETYISPQENLDKNLPGLLNSDRFYIERMEKIIRDFERQDDAWARKNENLNLATLLDSFLRGWPSVFLEGEEAQNKYAKWCELRRAHVWRHIHRMMLLKNLRIDPLLEENTVFQITFHEKRVSIKPLHLLTDDKFMILFSRKYGLTYYVDVWSRKSKTEVPKLGLSNREIGNSYFLAAKTAIKSGNVAHATDQVQKAFCVHPILAATSLFSEWWYQYARNTNKGFEQYSLLVKGIIAFKKQQHTQSIRYLRAFLSDNPSFLPDPYLLISYQEFLINRKIDALQSEYRKIANEYNKLVAEQQTKVAFLKSNHAIEAVEGGYRLHPEIAAAQPAIQFLSERSGSFSIQTSSMDRLGIFRVWQELEIITKNLPLIMEQIKTIQSRLDQANEGLWTALKDSPDDNFKKAHHIDPNYVGGVLAEKRLGFSDGYYLRFQPLLDLVQADEYVRIARQMNTLATHLKTSQVSLSDLKREIGKSVETEMLDTENIQLLIDFQKDLASFSKMDSITRELVFRSVLMQITQEFLKKALQQYADAEWRLPNFAEPLKRSIAAYPEYRTQYRVALEKMISSKVALANFSPHATFDILDSGSYKVVALEIEASNGLVQIRDNENETHTLLQFHGLSSDETAHLIEETDKTEFLQHLPFSLGTNTAEKILNTQIIPAPESRLWSQLIQNLSESLIKVLAYSFMSPVPDLFPAPQEVMTVFDNAPIIERFDADLKIIEMKFLKNLDQDSVTRVVAI